jgi:uncharacterized protein (DUF1499 family)
MAHESFQASQTPLSAEESAPDLGKGRRAASAMGWSSVLVALGGGIAELLGGLGYRLQWWPVGTGIVTLGVGAVAAAAAVVIALAALAMAWLADVRRAVGIAAAGLLIGAALAAPPLVMWRRAATLPAIHDISTDTENPPQFSAVVPLRASAPNGLEYSADTATQQKTAYPELGPVVLPQTPSLAFELAVRAAHEMGWEVVSVSPPDLRIEATATSWLFGFKDDVVVRIMPAAQGSRVDVRSVSRVGKSDVGVNASRIRAYLRTLDGLSRGAG